MSCLDYCILCKAPLDGCQNPPLCDLCDNEDNLTKEEVATLNLWAGGNFYTYKGKIGSDIERNRLHKS